MSIPTEDRNFQKLSAAEQRKLGLPEGWKIFSPYPFAGINQKDSIYAMPDQKFFWCENFIRIGNGKLRTVPDVGAVIYTAPAGKKIITPGGLFFYTIGITDYMVAFLDNGTAVQVNVATLAQTTISTPDNTFSKPGGAAPEAGMWGSQYLLISNNNTPNDYWVWDGFVLYSAGSLSPTVVMTNGGSGYTSAPAVSFSGGSGSGATANAIVTNGVVTAVKLSNAGSGWKVGETVTVGFSGGGGTAAAATVSLMPFGASGDTLETFLGRVWLGHPFDAPSGLPQGGVINVSAPGLFANFNTSQGALIFTNTDRFLIKEFTNLIQSNGYLYPIGDSSVNVISNVQTAGNPPITTFNYQNTDPTIGSPFHNTVQPFSRAIAMLNPLGAYVLYGGSVNRVSGDINDLFDTAVFPPTQGGITPSASVAYIHDILYYIALVTITDPFTKVPRNVMLLWDEKEWFVATQSMSVTFICQQTVNSRQSTYGTDGTSVRRLFDTPSSALQKVLTTKLYGSQMFFVVKMGFNVMLQGEDKSGEGASVSLVLNTETESIALPYQADLTTPMVFTGPVEDAFGAFLGLTIASTSPDFIINDIGIGYGEHTGPFGSGTLNAPTAPTS